MNDQQTYHHNYRDVARLSHTVLLALVCMFLSLPSCTRNTENVSSIPTCEITAPLDSLVDSMFPVDNEPGCVLAVMRGDSIVYEKCKGVADLDSMKAITGNTVFNLSSSSKLFTSIAMLKLIDEGKLSLDDTLDKFFPEFPEEIFHKITIRHLMTHTSGLPDLRPCTPEEWADFISCNNTIFGDIDTYRLYGRVNEYMKLFQHLERTLYEPGSRYVRHDPSYMLITPLIERITGEDFETWMNENIFMPAGVNGSIFYFQPTHEYKNMAHAYIQPGNNSARRARLRSDGRWGEADYGEVDFFLSRADRGAFGSARTFLRFISALYSFKVVPESILTQTTYDIYYDSKMPNVHYGLGNALLTEPGMPLKRYHMYNNGGFQIIEATWPNAGISYVMFANRNDWDFRSTAAKIDEIIKSKGWLN